MATAIPSRFFLSWGMYSGNMCHPTPPTHKNPITTIEGATSGHALDPTFAIFRDIKPVSCQDQPSGYLTDLTAEHLADLELWLQAVPAQPSGPSGPSGLLEGLCQSIAREARLFLRPRIPILVPRQSNKSFRRGDEARWLLTMVKCHF